MGLSRLRLTGLALIVFVCGAWQQPAGLPTQAEIDQILKGLSQITGFQIRRALPFQMVNREQINRYLNDQIKHAIRPDEIRADEITMKKFGFVPPDFDLKQNTIDLLTEQAAAFYDFRRKKLFISDWAAENMREEAIVHELAHALADQNVNIQKFMNGGHHDSEAALARQAVVEGQASWLMVEYVARRYGRTLADANTAKQLLNHDNSGDQGDFPVFAQAPLYIRVTLTFPYDYGDLFQQAAYLHDGRDSFAGVFRQPPVSTSQVLHPADRYFANVKPTDPDLPKPLKGSHGYVGGAMGELDVSIQLRQYLNRDEADALAPKFRGGSYRIDEVKKSHRMELLYASEWENEDAAARYLRDYVSVLRGKWKQCEITSNEPLRITGKSEDGYFAVERDGTRVLSREGFADPPITTQKH